MQLCAATANYAIYNKSNVKIQVFLKSNDPTKPSSYYQAISVGDKYLVDKDVQATVIFMDFSKKTKLSQGSFLKPSDPAFISTLTWDGTEVKEAKEKSTD